MLASVLVHNYFEKDQMLWWREGYLLVKFSRGEVVVDNSRLESGV